MVDVADAPVLAILTRAPSSGGKTRLFASLGVPSDRALLEALLLDTLDGAAAPGVRRMVAVMPADACEEVRRLVRDTDVEVLPQPDGHLGERMRALMETVLARRASSVALIGSDLPHVTPAAITEAFAAAARDPDTVVLGPASDGGYYLIGAQRVPDVFTHIDWGSGRVLAQTEEAARAKGFKVHHLQTMTDIDTAEDLRHAVAGGHAVRTAAWLKRHRV